MPYEDNFVDISENNQSVENHNGVSVSDGHLDHTINQEGGSSSSATGAAEKSLGGSSAKKARVAVNTGGTVTESSRTNVESLTYDPVHFIRSHSKNNDPADIQTQVRQ